ncbi:oxidoreductase [Moesziomyces antarcticus]|uniref:3-dehydrosphinganine reductase n=1 Tax=Pseudozyma antarctica TaxID=84753 RepID=A0A081CH82_PSEA2|nr:oxidoreductase [Moesziomyces antarcticus]GAK66028.1 oxidoreductase [Moesziomyces antarcticus]
MGLLGGKKWKPQGKDVFITGGSQGLGLALAELLAAKGANVTICSRTESKLREAVEQVKAAAKSSQQRIEYVAADVSTFEGAKEAIASRDVVPDTVFCCAGGAKPGFFLEQTESDFEQGMKTDYWTCLATAHVSTFRALQLKTSSVSPRLHPDRSLTLPSSSLHNLERQAAANAMARNKVVDGKIVLVSSLLGFTGLIGYSQYAPMKYAIRGLAETLRSELLLYGISVQAYFPASILSPGFEQENKTKPKVTLEIEEGDSPLTPEQCAKGLVKGVERGHFFITTDFNSELFRVAALGSAPTNSAVLDRALALISWIAIPIWRSFVADRAVKKHRKEHLASLTAKAQS